eukprot:TRINITY_DN116242_c0_g1_i1.p1 TRINITY_DN116242_c0_g1~~TRINITY_DN116242_c0_g1_i1.p1  ORF type:complete len:200 (-),score=62.57 TRINITY_DN116242_c0_g1_i1:236-757(-)
MAAAGSKNEATAADAQLRRDLADFGERGYADQSQLAGDGHHDEMRARERLMENMQKKSELNDFRKEVFREEFNAKAPSLQVRPRTAGPAAPAGAVKRGLPGFMKLKSKDNFENALEEPPHKKAKSQEELGTASPDVGASSPLPDAGNASPTSSALGTPLGLGGYASSSEEEDE